MKTPILLTALAVATLALPSLAQRRDNQDKKMECGNYSRRDSDYRFCEIKETNLPATGRLEIDGKPNGGVTVRGWSRSDVLVRAKLEARGESDAEARDMAGRVNVVTSGGVIRADGPKSERRSWWSVSYEIFTPFKTSVKASTVNGGVTLSDLEGEIDARTTNGGLNIARLAGNVTGHTTNGGVKVELDGTSWSGSGLDVGTTNGGVKLAIPANYSAQVETGTTNGAMRVDFPVTVSGNLNQKQMSFRLGSGGAPIKVKTTNGSVTVSKL